MPAPAVSDAWSVAADVMYWDDLHLLSCRVFRLGSHQRITVVISDLPDHCRG